MNSRSAEHTPRTRSHSIVRLCVKIRVLRKGSWLLSCFRQACCDPWQGMEEQVMSPSAQTALCSGAVLEGEIAGPLYGSADQGIPAGVSSGFGDLLSSAVEQPSVFVTPAVDGASMHNTDGTRALTATYPTSTQPQQLPATAAAYEENTLFPPSTTPAMTTEQVAHHVTVEGMTFSPPEDLPGLEGNASSSGSAPNVWFMRLGEFLQRRVSQAGASLVTPLIEARSATRASPPSRPHLSPPRSWSNGQGHQGLLSPEAESAMQQWERRWRRQGPLLNPTPQQPSDSSTGSLTKEQVLNEVQKQVALEMQAFHKQREDLETENAKLKSLLEQFVRSSQPRVQGQTGHSVQGTLGEPQGSALHPQSEVRVGIPPGLDQASGARPGEGLFRQPGDGRHLDEVFSVPGGYKGLLGDPSGPLASPGVPGGSLAGQQGNQGHEGGNPLGVPEGRDSGFRVDSGEPPGNAGHSTAPRAPTGALDPLGLLVQGMTQLQTAMEESLSQKAKEPELVKPGAIDLPKLPEISANSAIDIGDWLHGIQNYMGDLSNASGSWWREIMQCLRAYYEAYTRASHVGKLALRSEDYESAELKDPRWARVDKRAAAMLMASFPDSVKEELLASRLNGTLAILARVVVLYRPGSVVERQQVLSSLESPPPAANANEAVVSLRKWGRWMSRATDMGLQRPDPSVLLRGLDGLTKRPLLDHTDISFRISMLRYTLEVDTRPTEKGVWDLHSALMSEFEQVAYRGGPPSSSSTPFVKAIDGTGQPSQAKASGDAGSGGAPSLKSKAKAGQLPCKFFLTDAGCSKGSACTWSHAFTRKEKQGRCWTCGSRQHQQASCPIKGDGPSSPTAKTGSKAGAAKQPPSAAPTTTAPSKAVQAPPKAAAMTSASVAGIEASGSTAPVEVPESDLKNLLQEANAMLKEMRQLKALSLSSTRVDNMASFHHCNPHDGRSGLLDSGASHAFRVAEPEEVDAAPKVKVQLANGAEVTLAQNLGGTLLATSATSGEAVPIVPLGSLVQDLGCDLTWTRRKGLEIKHPSHGVIRPRVVGKCPLVGEACALDLIRELEELRVAELEMATTRTANAIWSWDAEQDWAAHLESFLSRGDRGSQLLALSAEDSPFRALTDSQRASLAEEIVLTDKAGWDYLKAFPVSRQRRKRMMTTKWVVHLYAGPGKGADPILKELDDGRVLLELDITRSKAFDMGKFGGVYRGLLWAAATGRVAGIIGAPPCRGSFDIPLVMKQLWLTLVAKAAAIRQGGFPVFAVLEGRKLFEIIKGDFGHGWEPLRDVWPLALQEMCLEEVAGVMATNLDFVLPLERTTSSGPSWSSSFKAAVLDSVQRWRKEPEALQVVKWAKKLDAKGFLEGFSEKELRMWRTHVRNNHTPYNRRCRTCVASSGVGRMHRRIKHPSAYCLSLDIAGPFRAKAADPDHRDYRYMLIGAYTYPKLEKAEGKDKRAKNGSMKESDPSDVWHPPDDCQEYAPSGDEAPMPLKVDADGGVGLSEADLAFANEEDDIFAEDVEDIPSEVIEDDLKGLTQEEFEKIFHEVGEEFDMDTFYISRPLRSRTSLEVHAAVQEVFLTLRAEGLHIARVHADRARELRTVPLRRWLLQRGAVSTYTEGQAPQANGRAENAVRWVKTQTKKLLTATSLPSSCWAMASVYATWARREEQLGRGRDVLPFGTPVHVRSKVYGAGGRHDLDLRWRAGTYVGPSLDVRGGHVVRFEDGQFMTSAHLRPHLVDSDKLVDLGKYEAIVFPPTRRVRAKSSQEGAADADPMDVDVGEHDPKHAAEQYALGLLKEDSLEPDQLEMLAYLLPATTAVPRRFGLEDGHKVWASGAFIHGPFAGLKKSTTTFPFATKVFTKYIRQIAPKHEFNSLAVNVNVEAKGHKDIHNVGTSMLVALSSFKDGGLEVDGPNGVEVLEVGRDPVFFNPKSTHSLGRVATVWCCLLIQFETVLS